MTKTITTIALLALSATVTHAAIISDGDIPTGQHGFIYMDGGAGTQYEFGQSAGYTNKGSSTENTNIYLGLSGWIYPSPGIHGNTLTIRNGAEMYFDSISFRSNDNSVIVTGAGTSLTLQGTISSPNSKDYPGNSLTVADGALVKENVIAAWTNVQLDSGFFAWVSGDTSNTLQHMVLNGVISYWDEASYSWATVSSIDEIDNYFSIVAYESDEAGFAATGHHGLGGYTVITTANAVPEPATYALIFGTAVAGVALLRRRHRHPCVSLS